MLFMQGFHDIFHDSRRKIIQKKLEWN